MARLGALPSRSIVKGFKGSVDFYMWMGRLPVARKWPLNQPRQPTQPEAAMQHKFRLVTQSYRDLDPLFVRALNSLVEGTQQRNFDLYQSLQYGYQQGEYNAPARDLTPEESIVQITLAAAPTDTLTTQPVNSVNYQNFHFLEAVVPWDLALFNKYRLTISGKGTEAGQTIDARMSHLASGLPFGDGSPDLSLTSADSLYDSGAKDLVNSLPGPATAVLSLKGSNATSDIQLHWARLDLWTELP